MKIAYLPMSQNFKAPGDRRRFYGFAKKKKLKIELYNSNVHYDYIVITQKADLSFWSKFKKNNTKIIFDLCDAYLLEDFSLKKTFRGTAKFLSRQNLYFNFNYEQLIKKMCLNSNTVICTTAKQKKSILPYCSDVRIILDLFDDDLQHNKKKNKFPNRVLSLFWEGQSGNLNSLKSISNVLNFFLKKNLVKLNVVTDLSYNFIPGINFKLSSINFLKNILNVKKNIYLYEWTKENLINISQESDVGIIPMKNFLNGMYANKPANKMHLMWKLGLPVLASPSYSHSLSQRQSGIDLLCKNEQDWKKKIFFFINYQKEIISIRDQLLIHSNTFLLDKKELSEWENIFNI
jgi:hypothetical protein